MRGVVGSRWWGRAAASWAGLFALVHLYWALGGSVGLAESAGRTLAQERPLGFVLTGLYGVALALAVAAALGLLLTRDRSPRLLPLCGFTVSAVLLLRAGVVEALLLTDAGYGGGDIGAAQRFWSLVLWNPWFLVGGVLFGFAAAGARRRRPLG